MEERTILKISLFATIIGIIALYFISVSSEVSEINEPSFELSKYVKVTGMVTKVSSTDKTTFIRITEPRTLDIVFFENISLKEGDMIEAMGNIEEYEGSYELIADKIVKK